MGRYGSEVENNRLYIDKAVKEATAKLQAREMDQKKIDALLAPISALANDDEQMQHQLEGLSLFIDQDGYDEISVPFRLQESVEVGDVPDLMPLISAAVPNGDYFVLTLSLGGVGLYRCSRYTAESIDLPDLPEDLCYVLRYDDFEKSLQPHMTARGGSEAMIHGHGMGKDQHEAFVKRFVDAVDNAIKPVAEREQIPLVLIGMEEAVGRYRRRTHYSKVVEESHYVDPHTLSLDDIIQHGWEIYEGETTKHHDEMIEALGSAPHSEHGVHGVLNALLQGRASVVFIDTKQVVRGSFDRTKGEAHVVPEDTEGVLENLINRVVVDALKTKADIIPCESDEIDLPAAILR